MFPSFNFPTQPIEEKSYDFSSCFNNSWHLEIEKNICKCCGKQQSSSGNNPRFLFNSPAAQDSLM